MYEPIPMHKTHFRRLELLGDSILKVLITDILFEMFIDESESKLVRRRDRLVSPSICNNIACQLGLQTLVLGEQTNSVLSDAVQAVIGAIYIDSEKDMIACRNWIQEQWSPYLEKERHRKQPVKRMAPTPLMVQLRAQKRCGGFLFPALLN